jgi:lysophospholipase L1-like esterase
VRAVLLLLAALLLGRADAAFAGATPLAAVPIARLNVPWWKTRHEAKLAEARQGPVDLVFLGDSITQQFEATGPDPLHDYRAVWQHFYGDRHALNLGFVGDATAHLLWRIEHGEIDGIAPKAAVILIGANNIGRLHWSAPDDVLGIETVVAEVRRRLPRTRLLLLGVLPSDRGAWASQTATEINIGLADRYGQGAVPYVTFHDASALFMKNGVIDRSLFRDPQEAPPHPALHPSPDGMDRLAAAIEPTLSALLGDRPHNR